MALPRFLKLTDIACALADSIVSLSSEIADSLRLIPHFDSLSLIPQSLSLISFFIFEIAIALATVIVIGSKMKETQQEANAKPETVKEKDIRETVAIDLSKRLKDLHSVNDATSFKGRSAIDMEALF